MTESATESAEQLAIEPVTEPVLAALRAHPSYEAVRVRNAAAGNNREPSLLELQEHADNAAHDALSKREKITHLIDQALETMRHQVKHNAPVSPDLIRQIEAV